MSIPSKTNPGNFFEDFHIGKIIEHATPRTVTEGDLALYTALYGGRFAVSSSAEFAKAIGYEHWPVDDLLVFHLVFGKTVPDISLNAVANLGYAECRFLRIVRVGDTLNSVSEVIGVKENSNGKTGVVYVRSRGFNQHGECVLEFIRWVMVRKKDIASKAPDVVVPDLQEAVAVAQLGDACPEIADKAWNTQLSGSIHLWDDYKIGEKIDHVDGITVEESDHMLATRLYQNTAKVHFNQFSEAQGRFGRRLIYGGHVISLARAISFNGLGNGFHLAAINGGSHIAPLFAGDTVFAWSEVHDRQPLAGRDDVGALRVTTTATKDMPCSGFPDRDNSTKEAGVILELDYWLLVPRRI